MKLKSLLLSICIWAFSITNAQTTLTPSERAEILLSQLTLKEKVSLLGFRSEPVERLNIPAYNWWNEALHGIARAGEATVFPQAIAMAASFNDSLLYQVASAISTEARAKYNISNKKAGVAQYRGLTFWSPNINIFRDPRWGRGQETYGEDPYLTSRMGIAFVKGMQGSDSKYLKTAACAKHFAVHSGPEFNRHSFNAIVNEIDLRETYLYAFCKLVTEGKVEAIMGAYNRVNGEPCNISKTLHTILRKEWGFKGHVVTDCDALDDIWKGHKILPNRLKVAAAAIKGGVNLDCSNLLQSELEEAVKQNLVTEKEIDVALKPILETQFKLGFFDPADKNPYSGYDEKDIRSTEHIALAREMGRQSIVLLKNNNQVLPLRKEKYKSILVSGNNAGSIDPLLGNYYGISPEMCTFIEGIVQATGKAYSVEYETGYNLMDSVRFGGLWTVGNCDAVIACIGYTPQLEGEEGEAFLTGKRKDKPYQLPPSNIRYLQEIRRRTQGKPLIAVITGGSAMQLYDIQEYCDAIILCWYLGEQGGNALADILFGKVSPAGRLPVTFYKKIEDLPNYDNYSMQNRTYRYYNGKVEYPFGFGLSYTSFKYQWMQPPLLSYSVKKDKEIHFSVSIENIGNMDGDEVVQVYLSYPVGQHTPIKTLKQFKRVNILQNNSRNITFSIPLDELKRWDTQNQCWNIQNGNYQIIIGDNSANNQLVANFFINK